MVLMGDSMVKWVTRLEVVGTGYKDGRASPLCSNAVKGASREGEGLTGATTWK